MVTVKSHVDPSDQIRYITLTHAGFQPTGSAWIPTCTWAAITATAHFNPRDPRGSQLPRHDEAGIARIISTHGIRVDPDNRAHPSHPLADNFNPRDPRGSRRKSASGCPKLSFNFNPRDPRGSRPESSEESIRTLINFNPRDPRGSRQQAIRSCCQPQLISTHGIRVDPDEIPDVKAAFHAIFQPTGSAWIPTLSATISSPISLNFNPRDPRGSRPLDLITRALVLPISTHGIRVDPDGA